MADSDNDSGGQNNRDGELSSQEQDRFLPIANVSRIMKKALPANAKISKDAKETVQECVSEFINFITGEASDKCQRGKRNTINGNDLLWAMTTLDFEDYVEPLKVYLQRYRELEGDKTTAATCRQGDQDSASGESTSSAAPAIIYNGGMYGGMVMMGHNQGPMYGSGGAGGYQHHQ